MDTHTQPKDIFKTNCLLPCIYFLFYSKMLVMSYEIHFITHLRVLTCSLKNSLRSTQIFACGIYLYLSF